MMTEVSAREAALQIEAALQESETRYRTVVETAPVAILIYVEQRVAMANPSCVKLFRARSEQELLGRDVWSLSHPSCHPLLRQRIERAMLRGEENPVAEVELLRCDGTRLSVDGVSVPIDYRGRRAMHVMMYDATHRKQAEALLRRQREEMERTLALQVAYQTVAGIAHELNQPLNALTTLGAAAERQAGELADLSPRLRETIAGIIAAARRSGNVLSELIGVLRQPAAPGGISRIENLIREVVTQTRAALPFAGTIDVLPCSEPVWVAGNATQIEKVLLNLIRNAIEACADHGPQGRIDIAVRATATEVLVSVSDNGPGVVPARCSELFQPFVSSKPGGIGMGLAIGRALAESLGGRLWHEPAAGGGAYFCLQLQRAPQPENP